MIRKLPKDVCAIFVLLCICSSAISSEVFSSVENSTISNSKISRSNESYDEKVAGQFELNEEEWSKFLLIKKGPLGYKNPDIEPLLALAMFSTNKKEQTKFLELYAKQQRFIWNKGKEIDEEYRKIYSNLYPGENPIDQTKIYTDPEMVHPTDRFMLVVRKDCISCSTTAQHFINTSRVFPRNGLDIYVQNTSSEEEVILWAKANVPESELSERDITLNQGSVFLESVLDGLDVNVAILRNGELTKTVSLLALMPLQNNE